MLRVVPGLLLVGLWAVPHDAPAAALAGLSTSLGLAGSLLALLALQGGSPAHTAAALGISVVMLLLLVVALKTRPAWVRLAPAPAAGRTGLPVLARAAQDDSERALLCAARDQFLRLQAAWDGADLEALRRLTTEGMFDELLEQLPERGPGPNRTDVLALEAHLISHETLGALELASIEFSGLVRESAERGAVPFREVWMLARQPSDGAWRLARQQALL